MQIYSRAPGCAGTVTTVPQDVHRISFTLKSSIGTGKSKDSPSFLPSCPIAPQPKQKAIPSSFKHAVCRDPQLTLMGTVKPYGPIRIHQPYVRYIPIVQRELHQDGLRVHHGRSFQVVGVFKILLQQWSRGEARHAELTRLVPAPRVDIPNFRLAHGVPQAAGDFLGNAPQGGDFSETITGFQITMTQLPMTTPC